MCAAPAPNGLSELKMLLRDLRPVLLRETLAARLLAYPALADCAERADPTRWAVLAQRAFGTCDEPRSFVAPLWQICDAWAMPTSNGAALGAAALGAAATAAGAVAVAQKSRESVIVDSLSQRVKEGLKYAQRASSSSLGAAGGAVLALTERERRALLEALGAGSPGSAQRAALLDEFRRKDLPILVRNIDAYRMEALARDSAARGATTAPTTRKWQGTLRCICCVLEKFKGIGDELFPTAPQGAAGGSTADTLWLELQATRSVYRSYQYVWQEQMSIGAADGGEEMAWGEADHLVFDDGIGASGGASTEGILTDLKNLRASFDDHIQRVPC